MKLLIPFLLCCFSVYAEIPVQGFPEGKWVGNSTCSLKTDGYTCAQTLTFTKFSLTESYSCSNGESGIDGIEFKLNQKTGELEGSDMPNFKLKCEDSKCTISNSEAPEYFDSYNFDGDKLTTESECENEAGESATYSGIFKREN